jgi:hypothetical protein
MEDKGITPEQIEAALQADVKALAKEIAATMNAAKAGRIIADTEEQVRDAHAVFRQRAYQKALDLLARQAGQKAFSPSRQRGPLEEQRQAEDHAPDGQRPAGG